MRERRGWQRCAVSLSFGALAINDVVAAALTVAFCEVRAGSTNHRAVNCVGVHEQLLSCPCYNDLLLHRGIGHEHRQL